MTAGVVEDSERSDAYHSLLAVLGGLKEIPVGAVIYEQVRHVLDEQEAAHRGLDRVYTMLLRLLLDAYMRNPTLEHVNQINTKLSDLRQALAQPALAPVSMSVPLPQPSPPTAEPETPAAEEFSLSQVLEQLLHGLPAQTQEVKTEPEESAEPPAVSPEQAVASDPVEPAAPDAGAVEQSTQVSGPPVERRVNSAYRLHLDRKRDEIAKLQEAFSQNVGEAITQNREFGALLQIELSALKQADSMQEIETLRQILVGGIEELIQGQRSLESKLHRTNDYLHLIKSDSERLRDELNKVRLLSLTDEFTGLPNRRAFMRRLQDEIGRAQRYGSPLALALLDLDEFKAVNDIHGHAAGDEVLRCYGANVLSILRHHDLVARYGGEEFAVLLPNTALEGAVAALNKVKNRALEISCPYEGRVLPVPSFSAGLTLYVPGDVYTTLIDRADRALYRAKRLGRNRVEVELGTPADEAPATDVTTDLSVEPG